MLDDVSGGTAALIGGAGFLAGWVDAVVGGGGLIQLPALLLGLPNAQPAQLLATNKIASLAGTTTAARTYIRRVPPDWSVALPMAASALLGSAAGAFIGIRIPKAAFNPIILVLLIVVGAYTVFRPNLGAVTATRFAGRAGTWRACAIGAGIGCYDGALGPGTGSFLVFALVGWLGYAFLDASVKAKVANFATNLGALLVFVPMGLVVWQVAVFLVPANLLGGYAGARTAVRFGSGFVRVVFVTVVTAFIIRIGGQLLHWWS